MATIADTVIEDTLPTATITAVEQTTDLELSTLIDFEATPEFREQFLLWRNAKLQEILAYLHDNWGLKEVTIDRLVMMPQFVLPDRGKRNEYGQVAPGQTFADFDGNVVPHPVTGQPMIFTVWRRVDLPTAKIEETEAPAAASAKPEVEPTQPAAAV
jgi:hypothetical protein